MKVRDAADLVEMFENRFNHSEDKFSRVKKQWQEDNDFSLGEQWDPGVKSRRSVVGKERPCITVNKIDPLVHMIVNEAKQKSLSVAAKPVDDKSDPTTALILSGLLRNAEYTSKAVRAYMWAYECAVRGGVGYFRVVNEFENEDSFDQTVRMKRIRNPNCVSFDPEAEEQNGRDATFCILSDEISKVKAKQLCENVDYDTSQIVPSRHVWSVGSGDAVRHGEMYWEEYEPDELIQLKDLTFVKKSEITPEAYKMIMATEGMVLQSRKIRKKTIMYSELCNSIVIQDPMVVNSKYIPVVRLVGREGYINGKLDYRGITRNSMDSNRMYNVMSSLLVERIGLAPRAPYIGAAGQFDGFEANWDNANNENLGRLEYNPVSSGGNLCPPPQKNDAPAGDATIERYMTITAMDIKDTSQLSDAFMGNTSNETSGKGIKARASQSSSATFDLADNCADSIEHGGRIAVDMFPRIYTGRKVVRIMGEDWKERVINLDAFQDDNGQVKQVTLDAGAYDVELTVASGDKTRRETAIEQLSFVLQTNPEAANLIMDVFVGNLDIKDADKIAKRFKSTLPPAVIAAEEDSEKDNPELEAFQQHAEQIVTQLTEQLKAMQAELQDALLKLKTKDGELEVKKGELDLKKDELKLKEVEVFAKIESDKEAAKNAGDSEGKKETKTEKGKEEPGDSNGDGLDDSTQLNLLLRKVHDNEQEVDQIHDQLELVTKILEKIQGGNGNAPVGPTQSPDAMTMGNGLPPAEADNVGETNG